MKTTSLGKIAEKFVADYLCSQGYSIMALNWRNQFCEIDIVAKKRKMIVFVEVKYRRNDIYGGGAASVTRDKQQRIKRAVAFWIMNNSQYNSHNLRLDVALVSGPIENPKIEYLENALIIDELE